MPLPAIIAAVTQPAATTPSSIELNDYPGYTQNGQTFTVTVGEVFHFDLIKNGVTEHHTATVKAIGANYIIFTIASQPFDVTVMGGQSALISVHQDGHGDVRLTVGAITAGSAQVTFRAVLSRAAAITKTPTLQTSYVWLWLLLIFIPIVGYAILHRRDN